MTDIKCTRCGNPGITYLVGEITKENSIDWYRCLCYFCDDCFLQVNVDHPENVYIRETDGFPEDHKKTILDKEKMLEDLKAKNKS